MLSRSRTVSSPFLEYKLHADTVRKEEDEISEPEEDSLAGQMNALKGGAAPQPKKRRAPVQEEESSGSDTEGSAGDHDSDETNTVSVFPP